MKEKYLLIKEKTLMNGELWGYISLLFSSKKEMEKKIKESIKHNNKHNKVWRRHNTIGGRYADKYTLKINFRKFKLVPIK